MKSWMTKQQLRYDGAYNINERLLMFKGKSFCHSSLALNSGSISGRQYNITIMIVYVCSAL